MKLSPHFTLAEMIYSRRAAQQGISNAPPEEALPLVREFCEVILEAIRARFGPVFITSGYRGSILNALISGVPDSQHIWTADHCAVDFQVRGYTLRVVFDWIRLESGLPFDQVTLEYGKVPDSEADDCIHISFVKPPRRQALMGATNNRSGYQRMEVAA